MGKDGPKMAPRWPMMVHGKPKMTSILEFAAKCIKHCVLQCFMAFQVLKIGKDGPKMAPRWPQDGPEWPAEGPKWPRMAPRWPQGASQFKNVGFPIGF